MNKTLFGCLVLCTSLVSAAALADNHRHTGHHENYLQHMAEQLDLSTEQQVSLRELHEEHRSEHRALREQHKSEVNALLTPEQQTALEEMRAERRARMAERRAEHAGHDDHKPGAH